MDRLRPAAEELGCVRELMNVRHITEGPSWADRQTAILQQTGDPSEVVRRLTEQSRLLPAAGV
jgi:gamma-glutamyl:cysteine ligase YbdK (ATP-grasp superfamily)